MRSLRGSAGLLMALTGLVTLFRSTVVCGEPLATVPRETQVAVNQSTQQRIEQLQSLLEAQTAKIESLKGQLDQAEQGTTSATRVEEIRKVVREMMADSEFRENLVPDVTQVGYDKGFYIRSADDDYMLRINGFMKIRYTGSERQSDNPRRQGIQKQDDINGFQINDLYMYFQGYLHSPKLTYSIVLTGDTRQAHDWRTYTAWINYEFAQELQVVAGLVKVPFGRQWLVGKSDLQFIDRSLANEVFYTGRSVGLGVYGTLAKRLSYTLALANGVANQDDTFHAQQLDTNFAYAARMVAHILGQPIKTEGDVEFSKDPQMEVGMSFAYGDDNGDSAPSVFYNIPDRIRAGRGIGGNAMADLTGSDLTQFGADYAFKYRGFSVQAEYFLRMVDGESEYSPWELRTLRHDSSHQQGGYIQTGYFIIPKRVEAIARVGGVWDNGDDNTWEYTFGVNYMPWGSRNFLLQADFTRIDEASVTSTAGGWSQNDDINMFRVQVQARF
jgi:hypothetical protein